MNRRRNAEWNRGLQTFDVRMKGSATIEMSILLPMLMVILLLLIYMSFYLYDRTALFCNSYVAAIYAVADPDEANEDSYEKALGQMESLLQGKLIGMTKPAVKIVIDYGEVHISYQGEVEIPIAGQTIFFGEWKAFHIQEEVSVRRHKPVTFIRQCRKVEQLVTTEKSE